MKIVSFRLKGKMAHFRKVYANSSALSYFLPPRTTLVGILAGLLGYERDSYYEIFNREQCKIAVTINRPIKKSMQTLNYLMIKKAGDFNGSQPYHSQTSTELIIPENIRDDHIEYQIWVHHSDEEIMQQMESNVREAMYMSKGISMALGPAYSLGWIEDGGNYTGEVKSKANPVPISSAIPMKLVKGLELEEMKQYYKVIKEEVPLEFNSERQIVHGGMGYMIVNLKSSPIFAQVEEYIELSNEKNILWME